MAATQKGAPMPLRSLRIRPLDAQHPGDCDRMEGHAASLTENSPG